MATEGAELRVVPGPAGVKGGCKGGQPFQHPGQQPGGGGQEHVLPESFLVRGGKVFSAGGGGDVGAEALGSPARASSCAHCEDPGLRRHERGAPSYEGEGPIRSRKAWKAESLESGGVVGGNLQ